MNGWPARKCNTIHGNLRFNPSGQSRVRSPGNIREAATCPIQEWTVEGAPINVFG